MPEPSPKVSASMRLVRMPIEAAIARFCVTARISRPRRVKRRSAEQAHEDQQREDDDPEPVVGDGDVPEIERAAHPGRVADVLVGGTEGGAHRLLQDQRQAPGREQRLQRPAVEEADDAALDQDADEAGNDECERNGDGKRIVEQRRIVGADHLLHHEGGVGAEHDHLAVRHVDDAHHAEGDGEADGGQQQHRAERKPVPGVLHRGPNAQDCSGSRRWRRPRLSSRREWRLPADLPSSRARPDRRAARITATASILSASDASVAIEHDRGARLDQRLPAPGRRFPSAIAWSSAASAFASLDLNTACAASRRLPDRAPSSVRLPSAASMMPTQAVVEPHRRKVGRRSAGDRLSGRGVEQAVGAVADENALALRAEQQPPLLQGADHRQPRADCRWRPRR